METSETLQERADARFERALFLTGATASGKTALGVELAQALDAEIISMDSMAIYRGMDVGAAKPTLEERRGIAHHMLDVAQPWQEYSAIDYLRESKRALDDVLARGKTALFVGGTPLYLKTLLFGAFDGPGADPEYRDALRRRAASEGVDSLWRELDACDHATALRLHPNDVKRVVRALEVYRLTGKPISERQREFSAPPLVSPGRVFILTWRRESLYARIERRVDLMMASGFLAEVERLTALERPMSATSSQAVGYRELAEVLRGETTLEDAVVKIKQHTRNLAKRQETGFRSLERDGARRVDADGKTLDELRDEILELVAREKMLPRETNT